VHTKAHTLIGGMKYAITGRVWEAWA